MSQRNRASVTCMDILNRGRMDWNFFNTSLLCGNKTLEVIGHMAYTSNVYRRIAFYLGPKARSIDQFFDFKCNDLLLSVLSVVRYLLNLYDITFSVALNDSADSMPPGSVSKLDEVLLSHSHCQTTADKKINSSLVIISHRIWLANWIQKQRANSFIGKTFWSNYCKASRALYFAICSTLQDKTFH